LSTYSNVVREILAINPAAYQDLVPPGVGSASARDAIESATIESVIGAPIVSPDDAQACLSALWLWHDFLDESHSISQEIDTPAGSFWHGIMHRREGDFGNAKYWFRRVGPHPVFGSLAVAAKEEAASQDTASAMAGEFAGDWDPYRFVDSCERAVKSGEASDHDLLRRIARREWQLLFDHCYRAAQGKA
jgi:hypothetical protein